MMRRSILVIAAFTSLLIITAAACTNSAGNAATATVKPDSATMVHRGEYLVNAHRLR